MFLRNVGWISTDYMSLYRRSIFLRLEFFSSQQTIATGQIIQFASVTMILILLIKRRLYRDWLRAGRPRGRGSSPSKVKIFILSTSSRSILGQPSLLSNLYRE
jgi:hypothetical protein